MNRLPGILCCTVLAAAAAIFARVLPLGAVTIALLLGLLGANLLTLPEGFTPGVTFSEKVILAWAIALLGFRMDYTVLLSLGALPLLLILSGILVTLGSALLLGRLLNMERDLALLIGVGNSFCGTSAIAATQGVLSARERSVGISIAVINLLGTVGIFLLPVVTMLFGLSPEGRGLAIGNTLQAVGQVTAAGFGLGELEGQTGMVIKLGRILMLTPMLLVLMPLKRQKGEGAPSWNRPKIPLFILAFILFSALNSTGILPKVAQVALAHAGKILLVVAMGAIGLKIKLKGLLASGAMALMLGGAVWAVQIIFSLTFIHLLT